MERLQRLVRSIQSPIFQSVREQEQWTEALRRSALNDVMEQYNRIGREVDVLAELASLSLPQQTWMEDLRFSTQAMVEGFEGLGSFAEQISDVSRLLLVDCQPLRHQVEAMQSAAGLLGQRLADYQAVEESEEREHLTVGVLEAWTAPPRMR